jgi:hypothetical protein
MATIDGTHRQRFTNRELGYWAAYSVHGNMLMYSATVTDGDRFLEAPDGYFQFNTWEGTAEQVARAHLLRYIDTTRFGEGSSPCPEFVNSPAWKSTATAEPARRNV